MTLKPTPGRTISQALVEIRERIGTAAARAGRAPAEVSLVAVSKMFPAHAVMEAIEAGQQDFGENRVEEAMPKLQSVRAQGGLARWHLIGHLQTRKVKDITGPVDSAPTAFALIHSVDSLKLASTISQRIARFPTTAPLPAPQSILLECNISGEESKSGFRVDGWEHKPEVFEAFVREVEPMLALPHIRVMGLMTMAPIVEHAEQARPYFASLRALREALRQRCPAATWEHLSMGMTDDFEIAIAEGSTLVRIGRAIFGERQLI